MYPAVMKMHNAAVQTALDLQHNAVLLLCKCGASLPCGSAVAGPGPMVMQGGLLLLQGAAVSPTLLQACSS